MLLLDRGAVMRFDAARAPSGTQKALWLTYSSRPPTIAARSSGSSTWLPPLRFESSAFQLRALELERVRDVLEKQQSEDEVLVLGRFDRAAKLVGSLEERGAVGAIGV